jgi:hypothetical protein
MRGITRSNSRRTTSAITLTPLPDIWTAGEGRLQGSDFRLNAIQQESGGKLEKGPIGGGGEEKEHRMREGENSRHGTDHVSVPLMSSSSNPSCKRRES